VWFEASLGKKQDHIGKKIPNIKRSGRVAQVPVASVRP
jgi:hypothetical protein